jgi:hypothetical protein
MKAMAYYRTNNTPLQIGERVEILGYPPGHTKGRVHSRVAVPCDQGDTFVVELVEWICVGVNATPVTFRLVVAHESNIIKEGQ